MSLVRGALLAGRFRTQHELNELSNDAQKKILIGEMAGRTNQPRTHFQEMNDFTLAGRAAVYIFLRDGRIRTEQQLKTVSDDDQRNILIVELDAQTGLGLSLQGFNDIELVLLGLGKSRPGDLRQGSFLRGVLLAGQFRTQHELNGISADAQKKILIGEMAGRTNQSAAHFQEMDDFTLAGVGAVYVFLRTARIRTEQQLKTISDDDQRNILIVEIGGQTGLGSKLQALRNMDLVRLGLGVDAGEVLKPLPEPLHPPSPGTPNIDVKTRPLVIRPELEITGTNFTPNARFHLIISNVPVKKGNDVIRDHAFDEEGGFEIFESFEIQEVSVNAHLPNIIVSVRDEKSGFIASKQVFPGPFVVRVPQT
jgi:hypothetical protein